MTRPTRVEVSGLLGIYELPHISQVLMIYRAPMSGPDCAAGDESEAAALFAWSEIPWDALAFPSVRWALECFREGGGPWLHTAPPVHLR